MGINLGSGFFGNSMPWAIRLVLEEEEIQSEKNF